MARQSTSPGARRDLDGPRAWSLASPDIDPPPPRRASGPAPLAAPWPSSAAALAAQRPRPSTDVRKKPASLQIISSSVRGAAADNLPSVKRYSRHDTTRPKSVGSPLPLIWERQIEPPVGAEVSPPSFTPRHPNHTLTSSLSSAQEHARAYASLVSGGRPTSLTQRFSSVQGQRKSPARSLTLDQTLPEASPSSVYDDDPGRPQHSRSSTMTTFEPPTPHLALQVDNGRTSPNHTTTEQGLTPKQPRSPGAKISSFFGWKSTSPQPNSNDSPTTTFSDRSLSPAHSPSAPPTPPPKDSYPPRLDSPYDAQDGYFSAGSRSPYPTPGDSPQVEQLLTELREVSAELAGSIRREMELEDEVDRYKSESPNAPPEPSRRTSDYYSDSGASSIRYPPGDSDTKMEALEKMRRKAEQEKARLRSELAQRVQDDHVQRRAKEMHVQSLEQQLQALSRGLGKPTDRELELEASLEDSRRRINEEKQFKENFEDLLAGMRQEIEAHRDERDNLRDEVVPQLRARVEGLESAAAETQRQTYENSRMQQELQSLKAENQTLVNARRLDMSQHARFESISEEQSPLSPMSPSSPMSGMGRSNSLARSRSIKQRSGSLSKGVAGKDYVELTPQTIKDVEDQRDALHRTLMSLLLRQDVQVKQHSKQLNALRKERDDALRSSPRRTVFNVEVKNLRSEVNQLRQRADDALEQKWQCEKGLSGLKMDLDRAQQETSSLRELLKEHDIFIPDSISSAASSSSQDAGPESLEKAYKDLRAAHDSSVSRLRALGPASPRRPESLEAAQARLDTLSLQVHHQLQSNQELRTRLAEAIGRGEAEQGASAAKITELQSKLRNVETQLVVAQQHSEDSVTEHEDHVRLLRDSQHAQNARHITRSVGGLSPGLASPSPSPHQLLLSPRSPFDARSPRLERTTSGVGVSVGQASKTAALEKKVSDLEATAVQAEEEMHGVVERMNRAQIEVAELQAERDEAMKQTRRLQREIEEERVRSLALAT